MGLSGMSHCVENESARGKKVEGEKRKKSKKIGELKIFREWVWKKGKFLGEKKEPEREHRLGALQTSKHRQRHKFWSKDDSAWARQWEWEGYDIQYLHLNIPTSGDGVMSQNDKISFCILVYLVPWPLIMKPGAHE